MSKEQDLAKNIIRVAGCVALPLEERIEMIKAAARELLKEMMESQQFKSTTVKDLLDNK